MIRAALLTAMAGLAACTAGLAVLADACHGGAVPMLAGRNIGEVGLAAGLPHRLVIPGSAAQPVAPGTLPIWVDEKGWTTRVGCA